MTVPSLVSAPVTVPLPLRVVDTRRPARPASSRAPAEVSRIALLRVSVAPWRRTSVPLETVVVPVYDTAPPVSVVVAAPDCVSEPLPLMRDRVRDLFLLRRTSEPLLTTL